MTLLGGERNWPTKTPFSVAAGSTALTQSVAATSRTGFPATVTGTVGSSARNSSPDAALMLNSTRLASTLVRSRPGESIASHSLGPTAIVVVPEADRKRDGSTGPGGPCIPAGPVVRARLGAPVARGRDGP
jgi:hypothetical protein